MSMTADRFFVVHSVGMTDPYVAGECKTYEERDELAASLYATVDEDDVLFWLDVRANGEVEIGAYSGGFHDDALQAARE
jgi:hypothetical protein